MKIDTVPMKVLAVLKQRYAHLPTRRLIQLIAESRRHSREKDPMAKGTCSAFSRPEHRMTMSKLGCLRAG